MDYSEHKQTHNGDAGEGSADKNQLSIGATALAMKMALVWNRGK